MLIKVRAKPGRVVNTLPRGGKLIPEEGTTLVENSAWIKRAIYVRGDLELVEDNEAPAKAQPLKKTVTDTPPVTPAADSAKN